MSEHALVEFTGTAPSAPSAPPVCDQKVVEHEQFARMQADLDSELIRVQVALIEEPLFLVEAGELGAA